MNCPFCKGGPLVPDPRRHSYTCPSCRRKTTDLELQRIGTETLKSARNKMGMSVGRIDNPFDSSWLLERLREPNVTVTSPFNPDFTMSAADYERQKTSGATIGDIQRAEYPFWRSQHLNPKMWTDSPVESAVEKDSLMSELEKKLTGRQT